MFRGVGQAVGLCIQVRPVDLVWISQEDDLGFAPWVIWPSDRVWQGRIRTGFDLAWHWSDGIF